MRIKAQKGQAGIEFIAIAMVLFFFLLFLLSLAIVFVVSDYIEYATFMAARTYKSGASRQPIQQRNAEIVFNAYFEKIQGIARRPNLDFVRTDANNVRTEGLLASYDIDIFYLPPIFTRTNAPSRMRLNAEAHLGRDPSHDECRAFFQQYAQRVGVDDPGFIEMMEDNGC